MGTLLSRKIRVSKLELACEYFNAEPISNAAKIAALRKWIQEDSNCLQALQETRNYNPNAHYWTREQVEIIFTHLGYPSAIKTEV